MKYLEYRDLFLERKLVEIRPTGSVFEINSAGLENDITFGGSLLGRLINSAIRKSKIEFQAKKIDSIVTSVKRELDALEGHLLGEDDKKEISSIMARLILDKIYNEVKSDHDVPKKLDELLGNKSIDGMIDAAIKYVKGVEIKDKDVLIDKLEKFKADLLKTRGESQDDEKDEKEAQSQSQGSQDGNSEDATKIFYTNAQKFLQSIVNLHLDIKNNTVKFSSDNNGNTNTYFDEEEYKKIPENNIQYLSKKAKSAYKAISVFSQSKVKDSNGNITIKEKEKVKLYKDEFLRLFKKIISIVTPQLINIHNNYITLLDSKDINKRKSICKKQISALEEVVSLETIKSKLFPELVNEEVENNQVSVKIKSIKSYKKLLEWYKSELSKLEGSNESLLLEEIDANVTDTETHAKASWNKVVKAYNTSGIVKYIPYIESLLNTMGKDKESRIAARKKVKEVCSQVIINYDNVGQPIPFDQLISESETVSTNDVAKSISLFGRVLLAYDEDLGLLGSFGKSSSTEGKEGGAGNHIKTFVKSFNEMKRVYPDVKAKQGKGEEVKKEEVKKESFTFLKNYSSFRLIRESDEGEVNIDDTDEEDTQTQDNQESDNETTNENRDDVQKSYFKFFREGEEKEWSVDENKVKEINEKDHKLSEIDISKEGDYDHIIAIVNLFGKAYNIYATDYIPSGRPAGRISLKTMREYEHIGKGDNKWEESSGPGFGPWAAKKILNKWNDGITKILEDPKYRKVLATGFVSKAESDTNTAMSDKTKQSGRTLMTFINEMLDNEEGTFKKHRKVIFSKYFNMDIKDTEETKQSGTGKKEGVLPKTDSEEVGKVYWQSNFAPKSITELLRTEQNSFIQFRGDDNQCYLIYMLPKSSDFPKERIFKIQKSSKDSKKESIVSKYTENVKIGGKDYDLSDLGFGNKVDQEVFIGYFDSTATTFKNGTSFEFKSIRVEDYKSNDFSKKVSNKIVIKSNPEILKVNVNSDKDPSKVIPKNVKVSQVDSRYDKKITKPEDIKKIITEIKK